MNGVHGQEETRILFDEYHAAQKPSECLLNIKSELQNRGYILSFFGKQINLPLLSDYDAVVVFIPSRGFSEDEIRAIKSYVEDGGGLIIFGENGEYMKGRGINSVVNSVSTLFGIEFNKDVVLDSEINKDGEEKYPIIKNFGEHPITRDIEGIGYISGCSLTVRSPAIALAFGNPTTIAGGREKENVVVSAVAEYGKGRVLAVGDIDFLVGSSTSGYRDADYLSFMDNENFALNIFEWAASIKKMTRKAEQLISMGHDLFAQGKYDQAKSEYERALELYLELYDSNDVLKSQEMITMCNKGLDADTAYKSGVEYYDKKEYANALSEFEKSESLYDEIGNTKGSEKVQEMINECRKPLDAEGAYQEGLGYCSGGVYDEAIVKFKEALSLYKELENDEKVTELQARIEETQNILNKREMRKRMFVFIGILTVVGVEFVIVYVFLRKPRVLSTSDIIYSEPVHCHSCGKKNVKGASYCCYCGTPLNSHYKLEKERNLEDLRRKFEEGDISEEEYQRIQDDLKKNL